MSRGKHKIVKTLIAAAELDLGATLYINYFGDDEEDVTPLHLSLSRGHFACAEALIADGCNVNAVKRDQVTYLQRIYSPSQPREGVAKQCSPTP